MPDIFNEIMNAQFLGVPVILIIGVLVVIIFIALKYKPSDGRKRLDLTKAIRADNDEMFSLFGEPTKKNLKGGFINVGYALGQFPIYWDKNLSALKNLRANQQLKNAARKHEADIEELTAFKITKKDVISKLVGMVGFRYKYILLPTKELTQATKEILFPSTLQPQEFLGVVITTKASRDYVENIAFKMNRQEELTEIADFVPKQNYLEVDTAKRVARAREEAKIEKEKYKGQIEGAEEV